MPVAGCESPVRAGRATPTRRSGQPTSLRQRGGPSLFSSLRVFSLRFPGNFFFAAPGHYPPNPAEVKRLRMHQATYTRHSDTFLQMAYVSCDRIRQILQSIRRSF